MHFFDAHLDLAMAAERGRDMHAPLATCRGTLLPAAVTLPSLREGHVRTCLGTVFTEAVADGKPVEHAYSYPADDADAAYRAGMRQIKLYHAWQDGRRDRADAPARGARRRTAPGAHSKATRPRTTRCAWAS